MGKRLPKRQMQKSDSFPKEGYAGEKLPHLVFLDVNTNVNTWFSALMTRVPCVGEFLFNQGDKFRVVAVYHSLVMADGRSNCGLHAIIDVKLLADPDAVQP